MINKQFGQGSSVGLIACSDGRARENSYAIDTIIEVLSNLELKVKLASTLYRMGDSPFSGTPQERAKELMKLFVDETVMAIFDVSGGDSANQVLPYLDYDIIRQNEKPFFGTSDLSVILNALYTCSGIITYHYQIMNLIGTHAISQRQLFKHLFFDEVHSAHKFETFQYSWLRGESMTGVVVGGNIQCFLKLSGTRYIPDPDGKVLFLESLRGSPSRVASLLSQLDQIGYFHRCRGLLVGTFTEMESKNSTPTVEELVLEITEKYRLPVAKTSELGHGDDAHCLPIGLHLLF